MIRRSISPECRRCGSSAGSTTRRTTMWSTALARTRCASCLATSIRRAISSWGTRTTRASLARRSSSAPSSEAPPRSPRMLHTTHLISAVDSHTAGEPTRVITAGLPQLPGTTMVEKRAYLKEHLDHLRTALAREPRGHEAMVLAFLTPPVTKASSMGVMFGNGVGYLEMCGHGSIGVAIVLVTLSMVPVEEPVTTVLLDTPAGVVQCRVHVEGGRARSVRLRN